MSHYIYHYDKAGNQWNVFLAEETHELYVCGFPTAEEAKAFCDAANKDQ